MRDVIVVGGGPVGLALAVLLTHRGLDVSVWERRHAPSDSSRAIGLHAPALEALSAAGVTDLFLDEAVLIRTGVARTRNRALGEVSFAHVSDRFPYVAALPQARTEWLLAQRAHELRPGLVSRGVTVRALLDEGTHVRLIGEATRPDGPRSDSPASAGSPVAAPVEDTARFVVAADGARSVIRSLLGIGAPTHMYPDTYVMGDVADDTTAGPVAVVHLAANGVVESFPLPGGLRRWVVWTGRRIAGPSPADLGSVVQHRTGVQLAVETTSMLSSFAVRRRLAERMVAGRTVLIGDAAHEISPIGGQGMNLGWLDAARLAPILAAAVRFGDDASGPLAHFDSARRRSARRAAVQAEINMALGRPVRGLRGGARNAALALALATPASRLLADAYAMNPLR